MSDPLGLIGGNTGAGRISPLRHDVPGGAAGQAQQGPSFKDVLLRNIDEINKLQQDATRAIEDLQSGSRTDVEGVLIATAKADTAFKMIQAVRNQVVKAYEEIQNMRV
jgi:flagellar hook-basal body complex protein FliE